MPKRKSALTRKRERIRLLIVGAIVFGIIVFFTLLAVLVRLPQVTITAVTIDGAKTVNAEAVEKKVQELLEGSYFFLIPKKNALVYPKGNIETILKETFLPISIVSADRSSFQELAILLEERVPVGTWCDASATNTPCFLVDETGLLFLEKEHTLVSETLVFRSAGLTRGDVFLGGELPQLRTFLEKVQKEVDKVPQEILVDEHEDVYVRFEGGGELRFMRTSESTALLDNIASVFSSVRFQNNDPFEYVDFRFGNKVYVKFIE